MTKQFQHIIPRVYLKQFGYRKDNGHWMVSIRDKTLFSNMNLLGKFWWSQKSIDSYFGEYNIFDLLEDEEKQKLIEEGFGLIENRFLEIVNYLNHHNKINYKTKLDIDETTANFMCRSDFWYRHVKEWEQQPSYPHFLDYITHHLDDPQHVKDYLNEFTGEPLVNRLMIIFMSRIKDILGQLQIIVFVCPDGEGWFTSDIPVCMDNRGTPGDLIGRDAEVHFPLTRKYLIYYYNPLSDIHRNKDDVLEPYTKVEVEWELYSNITDVIFRHSHKCIIAPTQMTGFQFKTILAHK